MVWSRNCHNYYDFAHPSWPPSILAVRIIRIQSPEGPPGMGPQAPASRYSIHCHAVNPTWGGISHLRASQSRELARTPAFVGAVLFSCVFLITHPFYKFSAQMTDHFSGKIFCRFSFLNTCLDKINVCAAFNMWSMVLIRSLSNRTYRVLDSGLESTRCAAATGVNFSRHFFLIYHNCCQSVPCICGKKRIKSKSKSMRERMGEILICCRHEILFCVNAKSASLALLSFPRRHNFNSEIYLTNTFSGFIYIYWGRRLCGPFFFVSRMNCSTEIRIRLQRSKIFGSTLTH